MEKVRVLVIGLGRIGSMLEEDKLREKPCTHSGAIAANEDCVLVGGVDTEEAKRVDFSRKWHVPSSWDAQQMIDIHKPDVICIATHPDSHYKYCLLAAKNGVRVVVCEKPLADTIAMARKIAKLEKKYGITIITNHERRYSLDYIRAKTILMDGKRLGRIHSVRATLYMGAYTRLIDQLWHDGTHLVDAIMFLSGGVLKHKKRCGAKLTLANRTCWLEGELKKDKKQLPIPVLIEVGSGRDHLIFEIEFSCYFGRLRIGNGIFEILESQPSPYAEKFRSLKKADDSFSGPTGYFANMIKDAVACAREKERIPVSTVQDGLRVIEYLNSVRSWK